MGLESVDQLRVFCLELSSPQPSPGGGTASAAAGAMAASLLMMVCGLTAKNKKYKDSKDRLDELLASLAKHRDELIRLAGEDAKAYDLVIERSRVRRANPNAENEASFQRALERAAEIPLKTAEACLGVLEQAIEVAKIGAKSASSDTGTAWELAEAGFNGAAMNVDINLKSIENETLSAITRGSLQTAENRIPGLKDNFLQILRAVEPEPAIPQAKTIPGR